MPPKAKDPKAKTLFKVGTPLKDVIPATVKNPPRESKPLKVPEQSNKVVQQEYQPIPDPEPWPGDEAVAAINLLAGDIISTKPHFETGDNIVFWRRPKQFLRKRYTIEADNEPPYMEMRSLYQFNDDSYSTRVETKEKIDFMLEQIETTFTICESFERVETSDEIEIRRKEFAEKQAQQQKAKKGAKKPEEQFDENPKMVADVKLSDVICTDDLPPDSRWIASQLQMIKDRDIKDCYTGKPLSSKIYPQKDGAPIYNPHGKYIVKLYYMGSERKVLISDHMPTDYRGKALLPQSVQESQLWPMIISKALLQLWEHQSSYSLVGDGFVMYALTGLLSETINLNQMDSWRLVDQMLNETHFTQKDVFVSVFGSKDKLNQNTVNRSRREYQNELLRNPKKQFDNYEEGIRRKTKSKHQEEEHVEEDSIMQQEDQAQEILKRPLLHITEYGRRRSQPRIVFDPSVTNLNTYFSYSVIESFTNENGFNMVYAQKRSEREMRLRQELLEISRTPMNSKMSKEDKYDLRKKKKELRERLQEDDKKRISLITQQPIKHRFLRVKSSISGKDKVVLYSPLGSDEIYIAKMCIINKLTKPPNYDMPEVKGDDKSVVSQTVKGDDALSVKPLDDFSALSNAQEPFLRGEGGFWIHEKEFTSFFEHLQIAYDPKRFNLQVHQIPQNIDSDLANYDNQELMIVQKNNDIEEKNEVQFLFGFQAKYAKNIDFNQQIRPFALLQRFDLESYESIYDYKLLNQCVSSQMIIMDNKNHIFRLNAYSPLNFTIWLASNNTIKTTSIFDYLIDYEGYQKQNFTLDYPACEANKYFLFFRFKIQVNTNKELGSFVYRIKSNNDNLLLKSLKIKLIEVPPPNNPLMLTTIEGVHKYLFESEYIIHGTQRFSLRANTIYYFILEGTPPYNTAEGTFDMDFLYNQEVQIQLLENVEPLRYSDKYIPSKYGIVFRERIFALDGQSNTQASLYCRLAEGQQVQQQQAPKGGKPGKAPEALEIAESEMKGERLIRLELFKGEESICYSYGINKAILSNVSLTGEYTLQAIFDLREWPEAKVRSDETENIFWFLTIFSSDTVGIVRDTAKEDRERAIKKSWEDKEPGRGANAKKARQKYMLTLKADLTPEELAIVNAPRITKKQREEEAKQAALKKGPKKDDKKGAKGGKPEPQVQEVVKERVFPKSEDHVNESINAFLSHLEQERIMDKQADHAGLINVRSEVQKREIIEEIMLGREEIAGILQRNLKMREELKLLQRDNKEILLNEFGSQRAAQKQDMSEVQQEREQFRQEFASLLKREQQLFDLCKQEKVGQPEEIEKLIQDAAQLNKELVQAAKQVANNWRIAQINDKINTALAAFDIDTLKSCLDQIGQFNIEGIDTTAAEDMLEEAAGNPNFVQEKLAELKKQGKKPAKK